MAVVFALLTGCVGSGDDDGSGSTGIGGGALCRSYKSRLIACDLLTEGEFPCEEPETESDKCSARCYLDSSCSDLALTLGCGDSFQLLDQLVACTDACRASGFKCDSGESISSSWECDGEEDCADGSDEDACASDYECKSGGSIPASWKCDGAEDCADGSDEVGCASMDAGPTFTCKSGATIPADWRCDQEPDCSDGSDEAGCAQRMCPGE